MAFACLRGGLVPGRSRRRLLRGAASLRLARRRRRSAGPPRAAMWRYGPGPAGCSSNSACRGPAGPPRRPAGSTLLLALTAARRHRALLAAGCHSHRSHGCKRQGRLPGSGRSAASVRGPVSRASKLPELPGGGGKGDDPQTSPDTPGLMSSCRRAAAGSALLAAVRGPRSLMLARAVGGLCRGV